MNRLLLLIVCFKNHEEIADFVKHCEVELDGLCDFAICDNSPEDEQRDMDDLLGALGPSVRWTLIQRPDNPGYLEGGLLALESFVAAHGWNSWILLSNTDIELVGGASWVRLLDRDHSVPLVLAPDVLEGSPERHMNPHLYTRRSIRRSFVDRWFCATTMTALIYLSLHLLLEGVRRRRPEEVLAGGTRTIYSAYGAIIVFSKTFMQLNAIDRNVPLFAEEYAIAEAALNSSVEVTYDPSIVARHAANAVTGPTLTRFRAKRIGTAFRYIYLDRRAAR